MGVLGLLINPVLIVGVGAIVFGSLGLGRANRWARSGLQPIGRTQAAWGLALGIIDTVGSIALKGALF